MLRAHKRKIYEDKFKEFIKMKHQFHGTSTLAIKCCISTVNVTKITDTVRTRVKIKMRVLKFSLSN